MDKDITKVLFSEEQLKKRIAELDTIIKKLYESFAIGRISEERGSVLYGSRARDGHPADDGFHGGLQLRQFDQILRRG